MPKVEIEAIGYSFELTYDGIIPAIEIEVAALRRELDALNGSVALTSFEFAPLTLPDWRYRFETADGRVWQQTFTLTDGERTRGTFSTVAGLWVLEDEPLPADFAPHREVRIRCIRLARNTQLTKIEVFWT